MQLWVFPGASAVVVFCSYITRLSLRLISKFASRHSLATRGKLMMMESVGNIFLVLVVFLPCSILAEDENDDIMPSHSPEGLMEHPSINGLEILIL